MEELKFWNNGNPIVALITGSGMKQRLIVDGKVVRTGHIQADPVIDLYNSVKTGPVPAAFQAQGLSSFSKSGDTITEARTIEWMAVDEIKTTRIAEIKGQAGGLILTRVPVHEQTNLIRRGVILNDKGRVNWSVSELVEWDAGLVLSDYVDAVRAASSQFEADLIAEIDPATIAALQPTWPVVPS